MQKYLVLNYFDLFPTQFAGHPGFLYTYSLTPITVTHTRSQYSPLSLSGLFAKLDFDI
jgi:hypothetical protein